METMDVVPLPEGFAKKTPSRECTVSSEEYSAGRIVSDGFSTVHRSDLAILTREQLLILVRFSNAIMSQNLPVKCILITLRTLRSNLNAELVEICYPDKESTDLVVHYMTKDGILHKKELPAAASGAFQMALSTGSIVKIDCCEFDSRFERSFDQHTDIELRNLLVCPLLDSKKVVWGVAAIANSATCLRDLNCANCCQMIYTFSSPASEMLNDINSAAKGELHCGTDSDFPTSRQCQKHDGNNYSLCNTDGVAVALSTDSGSNNPANITSIPVAAVGGFASPDTNESARTEASGVEHLLWDENTVTFVLQICEIGGQCISNAIGWRELDATRERATGLLTLMHSLFSDRLGIQSCVVALTTHARELIQAERCTVFIVDRSHDQLWSISSDDGSQIVAPLSHGMAGKCASKGEIIVIENACEDERFDPEVDLREGVEIRNVAWVPIKSEDCNRVLAVIEVINKQAEELLHFGEDDLRLLEIFSAIVGPQLEKSDFAAAGSKLEETEAGLAFKTVPQAMVSVSRQCISEPCIPEAEED